MRIIDYSVTRPLFLQAPLLPSLAAATAKVSPRFPSLRENTTTTTTTNNNNNIDNNNSNNNDNNVNAN